MRPGVHHDGLRGLGPGSTRAEAFAHLRRAFAEAGLDTPELDARILLTEALGVGPTDLALRPQEPIGDKGAARLCEHAARRLAHEPVARILGFQEFWALTFELSPETLMPRPDTETVVEAALAEIDDRTAALRVLDLGTGSGCLLVALLRELPNARGVGVDRAPAALAAARRNAGRNGVADRADVVAGDWSAALAGEFDLIVSNPPYILSGAIQALPAEVRDHDPAGALDGGSDGLDAYRAILADAPRLLARAARLVLEIGFDQEAAVRTLAGAAGLEVKRVANDLGGRPRALVAVAPRG
jgi:release factor glutamine methyltransferase